LSIVTFVHYSGEEACTVAIRREGTKNNNNYNININNHNSNYCNVIFSMEAGDIFSVRVKIQAEGTR
jgi:hypothetical protein